MEQAEGTRRRGLTRKAVVARALKIGEAEGLEAVSLRRLASELGVTPMALYRHVRDKQDLINAMTEVVLEGIDVTVGFRPSMSWTDRVRRALSNFKDQMEARPLALPLSIAYSGDGPLAFWKMSEDVLAILLGAGFRRREAVILVRILSNLISGYLLIRRAPESPQPLDERELDLLRRRLELNQMSLPPDQFPHSIASAREVAEVWLADPDRWWGDTVDLIVAGIDRMLEKSQARSSRKAT